MQKILLPLFLTVIALPAPCQQPRVTEIKDIPDYVLYDSFFFRVSWLEELADNTRSRGEDDSSVRSTIQRQAGLTLDEAASLKRIVRDWKARTSALKTAAQSGGVKSVPEEHRQIMTELIGELKAALPAKTFAQLDAFVHASSTAKMIHVTPPAK